MSKLQDYLRDYKSRHDLSLREMEAKLGISRNAIHLIIEHNQRPEPDTLNTLAKAFNMPLWQLLDMAEYDLGYSENQRISAQLQAAPELRRVFQRVVELMPQEQEWLIAIVDAIIDNKPH